RPLLALQDLGIRVSHWAPTGAEWDLDTADLIAYFAGRADVGAVAAHLDRVGDGRRLLLAADHAARHRVPVVALPAPAEEDPVLDAALRQFGVIRAQDPDELRDTAALLARARPPRAEGVAVYGTSPDAVARVAGLVEAAGLSPHRPARGPETAGADREAVAALLADPSVGVLICPVPAPVPPRTDRLVEDLIEAAEATDTLVCVVWGSPLGTEEAYRTGLLGSRRVATFRTYGACVRAVRAHLDHHRFTANHRSPFEGAARVPSPSAGKARALLHPGRRLSEHAAKQLLRAYGIRVPREHLVTSAAAAVRAAGLAGYPVVMKASAPELTHRTELGLVQIGLTSASQVRDGYRTLTDIARYEGIELDGVLICQMVEYGVDLAVRVGHDPRFGPTVTVGLGGALPEALPDTATRVPPFGEDQARAMLRELRGHALLDGARAAPPSDVDALVEVLLRVQHLALELGDELAELSIDPLVVLGRGQGAVALDSLAVCR
ncbi:acetate--CoA ligase family protein, partial [Streptomyces sp. URMC 123]|uniref:acetate--CoA ligase family protein n=1 Tax=Streptomyces sp. URMC 123 TaxID=3423403 RepID=UPI003F1CC07E